MREIQASEAKTHLPQLLDEIERGESIIITRHGRAIARLIPEDAMRRDTQAEAVERLKALRATMPRVPLDELMAMMTTRRFRHLPVITNDALVGIISIGDVVKHHVAEVEMEAMAMREYITHS